VISSFRRGVNEIRALLGIYAVQIGIYLPSSSQTVFVSVALENGTDKTEERKISPSTSARGV